MNSNKKLVLGVLTIFLWILGLSDRSSDLSAKHIIGGEMLYECMGASSGGMTYRIQMVLYRDCSDATGANFDPLAPIGIYRWDSTNYRFFAQLNVARGTVISVDPVDNPCLILPPGICVQTTTYEFTVELPIFAGSYIINYSRCCRNNTISNIVAPQDAGASFSIEITDIAQTSCNNSPTFDEYPPIVICIDQEIRFNHRATDAEGDQLVYSFCAPKIGGGPFGSNERPGDENACDGITPDPQRCLPPYESVRFQPGFSMTNPLPGAMDMTINTMTGMIDGVPNAVGKFVVGVCVTEFRDGKKMTEVRRDFQFNVAICEEKVFAAVLSDTTIGGESIINSCGPLTVDFINESFQEEFIQNYLWEFDVNGSTVSADTRDASITFPSTGFYPGRMLINQGFDCADSLELAVNVFPPLEADFEYVYDTCIAGPVSFTDLSSTDAAGGLTDWSWNFGEGSRSIFRNPDHLYAVPGNHSVGLTITDVNGCRDTEIQTISYFPVPALLVIEPSTFRGCAPGNITFLNLSTPIDSTYDILWDFGDGNSATEISPTHTYTQEGTYSVGVDLTSPIGCATSAFFTDWIIIRPGPTAGFSYSPEEPSNLDPTVSFTDLSQNGIGWFWLFDDGNFSQERNPTHTFVDTGIQIVRQIVEHPSGCTDTAVAEIDVRPIVSYFLPNAFTPNNDAVNDLYFGKGNITWMKDFSFSIWNRWGQKVFETSDPNQGWNGQMNNSGQSVPNGVYVALVSYVDPRGDGHEIKGFATVVR